MHPVFDNSHLAQKAEAYDFAREHLQSDMVAADRAATFPRDLWIACARQGIQGLAAPEDHGGKGDVDLLTSMLVMEGLGKGCRDNGLCFALNAQMWTVQLPIVDFGSDEQKAKYLPRFISGEIIGCHAVTEPNHGSDAFSMETHAEKVEGGYRLNGTKRLVSLAPIADVALLFATINPELGKWGVTAFLVDLHAEGISVSPPQEKMGLRTVPIGEIHLKDHFLAESQRLGPEGAGASISNHSLEIERCSILASQLGAMERQLDESVARAKSRKQFGKPIGQFQSVSNRLADMKLRLETTRLLLYQVAWLKERKQPAMMESAMLKLHLSESFLASSMDAIRTFGGDGYLTETEVERDLRDAVGGVLYAGTSAIQRNIIASMLGL
ncbi:MAG: acyl-CoA dehydrogenase [Verrucomicrobiaceae bacterium]|nr:acyl-CoA dehydrogenase [Verrucomicrobiaceae bacterium]